jgi:hypothetical protein
MSRTQDQLVAVTEKIIVANELENNIAYAYEFSDPDGVRSGKSGWSFGRSQFDTKNNPLALKCLSECGFDNTVIKGIVNQTIDISPFNAKLRAAFPVIDRYDAVQFRSVVCKAQAVTKKHGILLADDAALIAIADYDNQYYLSDVDKPGYLVHYLKRLGRAATAKDILDFKLNHTEYGKTAPGDCRRRYANLISIIAKA